LSGAAAIIEGNEPFYVGGSGDHASLRLPSGSSAATTPMCLALDQPTLRFLAKRDSGSPIGSLLVEAVFTDAGGGVETAPVTMVDNVGAWAPTPPLPLVASALTAGDVRYVSFRFTPQGASQWSIDDVYVDPYRTI
jgi:hypothetical protein